MHRRIQIVIGCVVAWALSGAAPVAAQEETSPDIELGSSRIGGPGLTERERRWVKSLDQPDEGMTETNIPPPGDKKRLPHLHYLAQKYVNGSAHKDACAKYDLIADEGGKEGIASAPFGERYAARAYLACAKIAFASTDFEKAEMLLAKSERYAQTTPKHAALRLKIKRDSYRKKLLNGDVNGALKLFSEAQQEDNNEDERIWMGEQLATMAWTAHKSGDKFRTEDLIRKVESVAPMNTQYRKLKAQLEGQQSVFQRLIIVVGAAVGFVILWNLLSAWRARARLGVRRNRYELDEDV